MDELPKAIKWVRDCQKRKHIVTQYNSDEDPSWEIRDEKNTYNKSKNFNVYDEEYKSFKTNVLIEPTNMDMNKPIEWNGDCLDFCKDGNLYFADAEIIGDSHSTFSKYDCEEISGMAIWGTMNMQGKFVQQSLKKDRSNDVCKEISDYYETQVGKNGVEVYMIHWGNAEKVYIKKYGIKIPENIKLVDLRKLAKNNGLKIRGTDSKALKDVMKYLYENKLLDFKYKSDVQNGFEATEQLVDYYHNDGPESNFEDIKYYNKLDCEALRVLWKFLSKDYKKYI